MRHSFHSPDYGNHYFERGGRDHHVVRELWAFIGRHRQHRHGGPMSGGFGGFGGEGDGLPRGRRISSDDLQLLLLALIAEQPSHGYELIKALDTRSNGFYSPSPGMVYPALTYLEEIGYVSVQPEGNRKRYVLADTGREYLDKNRERVQFMLDRLRQIGEKMDSVRRAYSGDDTDADAGWRAELHGARHALKHALMRHRHASPDTQREISEILLRAAKDIDGLTG